MSTTTDRLADQAKEVNKDIQEMGQTVRDAAQEKIGQVGEKASEYYDEKSCKRDRDRGSPPSSLPQPAASGGRLGKGGYCCVRDLAHKTPSPAAQGGRGRS